MKESKVKSSPRSLHLRGEMFRSFPPSSNAPHAHTGFSSRVFGNGPSGTKEWEKNRHLPAWTILTSTTERLWLSSSESDLRRGMLRLWFLGQVAKKKAVCYSKRLSLLCYLFLQPHSFLKREALSFAAGMKECWSQHWKMHHNSELGTECPQWIRQWKQRCSCWWIHGNLTSGLRGQHE